MKQARFFSVTAILFVGMLAAAIRVDAADYSYSVERFELSGGSTFSDEFDGSSLGTNWEESDPTAVEANGKVALSSPGYVTYESGLGMYSQMSGIESIGNWSIQNGSGGFQATSTWNADIPSINQMYLMESVLEDEGQDIKQNITIGLYNFEQSVADSLGVVAGSGVVFASGAHDGENGSFVMRSVSINQDNITGENILLSILFDDNTNTFTGRFSLDGSTSAAPDEFVFYQKDDLVSANAEFQFGLIVDSFTETSPVPVPAAVWLFGSGIVGLVGMGRRRKS